MQETKDTQVQSLGWEDSLHKGMAIHSSILAWRISWTEEPGGLQSKGWQRVRHNWSDLARAPIGEKEDYRLHHRRYVRKIKQREWESKQMARHVDKSSCLTCGEIAGHIKVKRPEKDSLRQHLKIPAGSAVSTSKILLNVCNAGAKLLIT